MLRIIAGTVSAALLLCACADKESEVSTEEDIAALRARADQMEAALESSKGAGASADVQRSTPANLPADAVRLAPSAIVDWRGFQQPMVAATMFVPYGWIAEGGIDWGNQYACTNGYAYNWRAKSPDDAQGVVILPQQRWEWNDVGKPNKIGCPMAQIDNVQAYIDSVLQQVRPDARVLKRYGRDDIERNGAKLNGETNNGFQYTQTRLRAGEAFVSFTENGQDMRGVVTAAVLFTYIRTGGGNYGVTVNSWTGYALPTFVAYAPTSAFKPAFFDGVRRSFTPDPQWEAAIAGHNAAIGRIDREGVMKRAEISRQTYEDIRQMSQQAWERQQVSADRRAREFSEAIRDVETYDDPKSNLGQVELDSAYEHAWRLDDGTYVLTNDHSFNPVESTGQFGEQLGVSR